MDDSRNDLTVRKSNEFIQKFRFSLSKTELRLVNYIIANIDSPLYSEEFNTMTFDISEFYKAMDIENPDGKTYDYIKEIIRGLKNKTSDYVDVGEYETIVSWIEKPKFYKGKGIVKLKLDDDLKPYLLQMNGYIQAKMNYYYQMTSQYSMRLYELLKSYDGFPYKEFDVDDLKIRIDAMNKSYSNFGVFRIKVLDIAIKEINEITDLFVSYEEGKKRGRKILTIKFNIRKKTKKNQEKVIEAQFKNVEEEKNEEQTSLYDNMKEEESVVKECEKMLKKYYLEKNQVISIYEAAKKIVPKHFTEDGSPAYLYVVDILEEKLDAYDEYKLKHVINDEFATLYSAVANNWMPNYPIKKDIPDFLEKAKYEVPVFEEPDFIERARRKHPTIDD